MSNQIVRIVTGIAITLPVSVNFRQERSVNPVKIERDRIVEPVFERVSIWWTAIYSFRTSNRQVVMPQPILSHGILHVISGRRCCELKFGICKSILDVPSSTAESGQSDL